MTASLGRAILLIAYAIPAIANQMSPLVAVVAFHIVVGLPAVVVSSVRVRSWLRTVGYEVAWLVAIVAHGLALVIASSASSAASPSAASSPAAAPAAIPSPSP